MTYVTRQQWEGDPPSIPGVKIVAVSPFEDLYNESGVRRLLPTLRFGIGVARYLVTHRADFDAVQVANFPFWSLLAARAALVASRVPVIVDWHEIWSFRFWCSYAGNLIGTCGFLVQRLCAAVSQHPLVASPRNLARLRSAGCRAEITVLAGYLPAATGTPAPEVAHPASLPPYALFVGRHIRDKGVDLLAELADLLHDPEKPIQLVVTGDGPARAALEKDLADRGLPTRCAGFVSDAELAELYRRASCVVVPSRREGYGMVVGEATSHGTPVVVADFEQNLAVDNVDPGRNGYVASPPTAAALAGRVADVVNEGQALRQSTAAWYHEAATTRTVEHSMAQLVDLYVQLTSARGAPRT